MGPLALQEKLQKKISRPEKRDGAGEPGSAESDVSENMDKEEAEEQGDNAEMGQASKLARSSSAATVAEARQQQLGGGSYHDPQESRVC